MHRQQTNHGDGSQSAAALSSRRIVRPVLVVAVILLAGLAGCSSRDPAKATSDPLAKVRLTRLIKFYQMYTALKNKPPANEQAFKDYLRTLPQEEKVAAGIGEDVDSLLVSPRDGQKYHIEYGTVARPTGQNRALAWEETGQDGKRYVALTMGYVQLYDEETFQQYKPKPKK
jgi:hypothetical protein